MKTFYKIILLFFFVSAVACKKESTKMPGCDMNGLWIGTWNSPGAASGTFFSPVTQENTELSGDVYIRFDLPSLENHGVDFSAKVTDRNLKSVFDISGVDITVSGNVENDTGITGNFNVSIGMSGTFSGTKIPTSTPTLNELYSSNEMLTSIVFIDQSLLVWTARSNYIDWDNFNYEVWQLDLNGSIMDTINLPFDGSLMGNSISFDGQKFWVLNSGSATICTYNLLGEKLNTFTSPAYYADALACIDNQVYIADGYNRVTHVFDQTVTEIKSIENKYISISSMCKYNGFLYMSTIFYNTILKTDMNGNILEAYILPEDVKSLCTSGTKLWCLTEKYISNLSGPGTSQYKIYEVQVD